MNKVYVYGWYGRGNIGDESYKLSFPQAFPDRQFTFGKVGSDGPIILGGGDILCEQYVKYVLDYPTKYKKFAVSVSANANSPFDLLAKFDHLYVRDTRSVNLLKARGIPCTYMPDISTGLVADVVKGKEWIQQAFKESSAELYNKCVGVVFNAHLNSGSDILARDYMNFLKVSWDLGKLMDETPASFILFPMSTSMPWDDRLTNACVATRCKFWKKNLVVYEKLTVQETLNMISACDVLISSRLHSGIFSLTSGVPFIDITHHDKNKGFLETAGLEDWSVSYWQFDYDHIKNLLNDMLSKEEYRQRAVDIKNKQLQVLRKESNNVCFV